MSKKGRGMDRDTFAVLMMFFGFVIFALFVFTGAKFIDYLSFKEHQYEEVYNYEYLGGYQDKGIVDIKGYNNLSEIYNSYYEDEPLTFEEAFRNLKIDKYDDESRTIDVYDLVMDYCDNSIDFYSYFKDAYIYQLDENTTVVFTSVSLNVDIKEKMVESYNFNGYLLEK